MSTQITYSPIKWRNNQDTALNAENLNSMDQGIVSAISEINKLHKEDENINSRITNFGVDNLHENYSKDKPYGISHVVFNAGDSSTYIPIYAADDPLNVTNINSIYSRHTQKYDTEVNWNNSGFIPAKGEIVIGTGKQVVERLVYNDDLQAFETISDEVDGFKLKVGDGENTWNSILELKGTQGPQGPQGKFQVIKNVTVNHIEASKTASATNDYPDPTKDETSGEVYTHLTLNLPRAYGSKKGEVILTPLEAGSTPDVIITENNPTDPGATDPDNYVYDYEFKLPQAPAITLTPNHKVLGPTESPSVVDIANNKYAPKFQFSIPRGYSANFISSSITLGKSGTNPEITIPAPTQNDTQGSFDYSLNLKVPRSYDSKIRNVDSVIEEAGSEPSVISSPSIIFEEDQGIYITDLTFKLPRAPQVEVDSQIEILDVNAQPTVTDINENIYSPKFKFSLPRANSITSTQLLKEEKVNGILTSTYDVRLLNNTSAGNFEVRHGVGIEKVQCDQSTEPGQATHMNFLLTNGERTEVDIYNGVSVASVECQQNNNMSESSKITVTLSSGESTSIDVYNGTGIKSMECEQNDVPGEASKLTLTLSSGEKTEVDIYNGKHGEVYWHTF